jgi:hypothetical protein
VGLFLLLSTSVIVECGAYVSSEVFAIWGDVVRYGGSVADVIPTFESFWGAFVYNSVIEVMDGFNFPLPTTANLERLLFSFPLRAIRAIRAIS